MPAGLYIHIPFCRSKCLYCDFFSSTDLSRVNRFLSALLREMIVRSRQEPFAGLVFSTIYFGGGTPSLLTAEQVAGIIEAAFKNFQWTSEVEISLEANPESVTVDRLQGWKAAGVNRLTIGVQSFIDEELRFLGRLHNAAQAEAAVEAARHTGFNNLGLDLIFGIPGQTMTSWRFSLAKALSYTPAHLSLYSLTYESGTPLWQKKQKGLFYPCSDKLERQLFLDAAARLTGAGYEHYEISNYALPGKRSRHNQLYWQQYPYLGLGPSAHSFDGFKREWNFRDLERYCEGIEHKGEAPADFEVISSALFAEEAILLGLRRREGIDLQAWRARFGYDLLPIAGKIAEPLGGLDETPLFSPSRRGSLLSFSNGKLGLTRQGILFYDALCAEFFMQLDKIVP
ncbi:MAG: radical SAM family heme chaperone HemW [candidate division KSB1 bacterium]|nr:radical SAM family heme chaperone HemW [candidate division KSB1 bacterium]MDZ7346812.1 radical SAM family heme chaperone HemW [candidate division KSB1 bacterium]